MKKKYFIIILAVLWIGFIFYNSSKPGTISNEKSKDITKIVMNTFNDDNRYINLYSLNKDNLIIRKLAHGFEYLILSVLISLTYFMGNTKIKLNNIIYTLFLSLLVANSDEFFQLFVPGRTSSVRDVFIDFLGAIVGVLLVILLKFMYSKATKLIKYKEIQS